MVNSDSGPERARAKWWTDWARLAARGNTDGVKSQAEVTNGITTDVAFQYLLGQRQAPTVAQYRKDISRFLDRYDQDVRGPDEIPVIGPESNLSAWNEPQLSKGPTRNNPLRAARFWVVLNSLCHPKNAPKRCNNVVAGEFAGTPGDLRYKAGKRTRNYEDDYRDYLSSRLKRVKKSSQNPKLHFPKVWGFHAYGDLRKYHYRQSGRAAITERYFKKYRGPGYSDPKVWLTAAGSYYQQPCRLLNSRRQQLYCRNDPSPEARLVFGERVQANALALLLRRMSLVIRDGDAHIRRFYYYHLHNVGSARAYGAIFPSDVQGRGGNRGEEWGLVGNRYDTAEERSEKTNYKFKGTTSFASPKQRRLAYCVLRDRVLSRGRPASCPTPPR